MHVLSSEYLDDDFFNDYELNEWLNDSFINTLQSLYWHTYVTSEIHWKKNEEKRKKINLKKKKNIQSFYCMVIAMKNIFFGVINYYKWWYTNKAQ